MVSEDVFKNTRIYAIKKGMDISSFVEEALKEKIAKTQELEQKQQELTELTATVNVARRLYQQLKQKPDFNSTISTDFIKNIIAGVDSKYHDYVTKAIIEEDPQKYSEIVPELQQLQEEQKRDLFSNDNANIEYQRYDTFCAEVWLPGLEFPTSTKELVKFHWDNIEKSFDKRPLYKFKEKFSNLNKEYRNKEELEEDLRMLHDKDRLSKRWNQKLMSCIVVVDKDKNAANQHFIDEMMKRMSQDGLLSSKQKKEIDQFYAENKVT